MTDVLNPGCVARAMLYRYWPTEIRVFIVFFAFSTYVIRRRRRWSAERVSRRRNNGPIDFLRVRSFVQTAFRNIQFDCTDGTTITIPHVCWGTRTTSQGQRRFFPSVVRSVYSRNPLIRTPFITPISGHDKHWPKLTKQTNR